jgi:parallel beta-helix repeat protein
MNTRKRAFSLAAGLMLLVLLATLSPPAGAPPALGAGTSAYTRPAGPFQSPTGTASYPEGIATVCTTGPPDCDYTSIQEAVDAAGEGDLIKVAAGTYSGVSARPAPPGYVFPPSSGLITQVVYLSETLTIQGGYTLTNWAEPDPVANPTTVDAQGLGRVFFVSADSGLISPTIAGLYITHGDGTGLGGQPMNPDLGMGGGIYTRYASVTLNNNWILDNAANWCSGLSLSTGSIAVEGNTISHNQATHVTGGMCVWAGSGTMQENTFSNNTSESGTGGLYVRLCDGITLEGNSFVSNTTQGPSGGLVLHESTVTLNGNTFVANTAGDYGGGARVSDCTVTLSGNTFISNTAGTEGGGLYLDGGSSTLDGNIIVGNEAQSDGGGLVPGF